MSRLFRGSWLRTLALAAVEQEMQSAAERCTRAELEPALTWAGELAVETCVCVGGRGRTGDVVSESPPSPSLHQLGLGCSRMADPSLQ